ncbi:MAG: hypothetical protein Q7J59_04750, partial [Elusimicrobiota bacterium]|nr:hypothetical protein [Elusimicrobiota bacterium]
MANHKLKKILTQMRDVGINELPSSYLSLIAPSASAQKKTPKKSPLRAAGSSGLLENLKSEYAACTMCP